MARISVFAEHKLHLFIKPNNVMKLVVQPQAFQILRGSVASSIAKDIKGDGVFGCDVENSS